MSSRLPSFVITGGPCAGKTTVLDAVRETYGDRVLIMPEVVTILLSHGFPRPGVDVPASDDWFRSFQKVVLAFHEQMEEQYAVMAKQNGAEVLLFDRGLIDGAAYMPGGQEIFLQEFNLEKSAVYARYDMIINLQSVATWSPELWNSLIATNPIRYDTVEEAQERDRRLQEVWGEHSNWQLISGKEGIANVVNSVINLIDPYLNSSK